MKQRKIPLTTILTIVFGLIAVAAAALLLKELAQSHNSHAPSGSTLRSAEDSAWSSKVKYDGKTYEQKSGLTTVLLLGIDNSGDKDPLIIGTGGRSDAIVLLVLNSKTQTTRILSISRDTITEVDMYDQKGDYITSGDMQINMQYAFGDSPRRSNYLTQKTVSELLCGRRIDGVLALTMDGIPAIGDILGGLTLTMDQAYSYIDPRYTQGATVTLNGEELERFIRYRDIEEFGSNEVRVARQNWLMEEVFHTLITRSLTNLVEEIMDKAAAYITSDLDAETLANIGKFELDPEELKLPGTSVQGDEHDEFYVDEKALQELLLELFYDPAD